MTESMPFSTPGMYSFGTAPPTIFDCEAASPAPGSFGSTTSLMRRELTGTARLLLVGVVDLGALALIVSRIGDLRSADVGVDLVGAAQNVDLDVEMEFAHALDDGSGRTPESVETRKDGSS